MKKLSVLVATVTVSYTHLDVYKRQFRGPGLYMLDIVAISTYIFRVDQVDRLAPAHVV